MSGKTSRLALATIVLAGGFGLATLGAAAAAESAVGKCAVEWKAAKANGTTGGKSWKEFYDQCGADQNGLSRNISLTPAEPKPAAAAAPAPAAPAPAAAATTPDSAATAAIAPPAAAATPIKKPKAAEEAAPGHFATEAAAKTKCAADEVVWVNAATKKIVLAGHDGYGKGKKGAYMCQSAAVAAGARAAKSEKQL